MTQFTFPTIAPDVDTGVTLSSYLNSWVPAVVSNNSGTGRPSYAVPGTLWHDTDFNQPFLFNGARDIRLATEDDLGSFLPLTGGTLTGTLLGQSAIFTTLATGIVGAPGYELNINGKAVIRNTLNIGVGDVVAGYSFSVKGSAALAAATNRNFAFFDENLNMRGGISNTDTLTSFWTGNGSGAVMTLDAAAAARIPGGVWFGPSSPFFPLVSFAWIYSLPVVGGFQVTLDGSTSMYLPHSTNIVRHRVLGDQLEIVLDTGSVLVAQLTASDSRLKENIVSAQEVSLEKVNSLRVVEFDWIEGDGRGVGHVSAGLIAQEVQAVLPEAVSDTGDFLSINQAPLIASLIGAVQELSAKLDEATKRILYLETRT